MIEKVLNILTIIGYIRKICALYDGLPTIKAAFRKSSSNHKPKPYKSLLSLPDKEFNFYDTNLSFLSSGGYLPLSANDDSLCKSLVNYKILKSVAGNRYEVNRKD